MKRFLTTTVLCLLPVTAQATALEDAPWAPRAAAYRLTLFLGNLDPLPWGKLENSWTAPVTGSAPNVSAMSKMSDAEASAVTLAVENQDRHALFMAATDVVENGILQFLAAANDALGTADAAQNVARAEALYRAFADGIQAGDRAGFRTLGRAWLTLNSAVGSAGLSQSGAPDPDREAFTEAREVIETYLRDNFTAANIAPRAKLTSVPETIVQSGAQIDVPVSLPPGSDIADQREFPRLVLQFEEAGLDEADMPLVAYGDMLFDSPQIFGGPARDLGISCSTCHNRSDVNRDFFIPGLSSHAGGMDVDGSFFNPMFNDRTDDHLDTPSLRGIRFTGPYGRDGREASLRDFTRNVIVTEFAGEEPTPFQLDALLAYMRQFDFLPNPQIDRAGRLTDQASDAAKRGEVLFSTPFDGLNGRACATCHTPDRSFRDGQTYDIGTSEAPFEGGTVTQLETPTLRNINFSAPYMHDGSLPTLGRVVEWFNDSKSLNLDAEERADLTAYLEAVGDGQDPYQVFEGRESTFRLAFDELTTFASTLNTLIPMQDAENISLLVDTVAPDLAADASVMVNQAAKPDVYRLSAHLRAVGDASAAGNWGDAATAWESFKALQSKINEGMY
ncbi:cytochrome c peroxidase [Parasedimentitalea psychrophila]|uniref:Cytochrome c peroxidase n=1 Tax=Parasedimentitalea psychrophila TaxID=2997337 RepID=A0A9Y2KV34_9RHOB|nr:cytochrome c peroxidase [Parasedimentitalea psychrophila]WIY23711.1 cytochrome c peroxidase [Parasedimentitalea psychrophila]